MRDPQKLLNFLLTITVCIVALFQASEEHRLTQPLELQSPVDLSRYEVVSTPAALPKITKTSLDLPKLPTHDRDEAQDEEKIADAPPSLSMSFSESFEKRLTKVEADVARLLKARSSSVVSSPIIAQPLPNFTYTTSGYELPYAAPPQRTFGSSSGYGSTGSSFGSQVTTNTLARYQTPIVVSQASPAPPATSYSTVTVTRSNSPPRQIRLRFRSRSRQVCNPTTGQCRMVEF